MTMQTTLKRDVRAKGIGLHSGNLLTLTLKPAPVNSGIVFRRMDLGGSVIHLGIKQIDFSALSLATTLREGNAQIQTTEHLLSAVFALGIDNLIVEIDGPEIPIMDGSAAPFLVLLEEAGLKKLLAPRRMLRITKAFSFEKNGKRVWVEPSNDFRISYEIHFDHPLIQSQEKTVVVHPDHFEAAIAPARTFGFLKDVNYLKSQGLIKGGSVDNAIVLDGDHMLNEGLRLHDEFVAHKILDFIGDLAVAGCGLQGHFHGYKAGHEMHALFLRELLAHSDCYQYEREESTLSYHRETLENLAGAA